MKSVLANLALSVATVIVGLAVAEAVLWQIAPPPRVGLPKNMFASQSNVWHLSPNFIGTMDNRVDFVGKRVTADAAGLRVVPSAPAEAPRRLFVIGDSQTFGHGLSDEEAWPNVLQRALTDAEAGVKVENHGIPAVNVDQYVRRLDTLVERIDDGDVVVVGLTWNDLITPQKPGEHEVKVVEGYLVKAETAHQEDLAARIRLYDSIGLYIPPFQDLKTLLESLSQTSALVHFTYPRAKAIYYRLRDHRPVAELVELGVPDGNMALLANMAARVKAQGASFAVALLPDKIFFEDAAWRTYSVGGRDYPVQNFMGHLAKPLCARFQLRCLDAFTILHQHQHDPVAFAVDGHYNEKGAEVIGIWLAGEIIADESLLGHQTPDPVGIGH